MSSLQEHFERSAGDTGPGERAFETATERFAAVDKKGALQPIHLRDVKLAG